MNAQDYITVAQAREMLGVSRSKMAKMLKDGELKYEHYTLDKREKHIRRADVERLMRDPHTPGNQLAIAV
jgi:excisionase family DNA binding protein